MQDQNYTKLKRNMYDEYCKKSLHITILNLQREEEGLICCTFTVTPFIERQKNMVKLIGLRIIIEMKYENMHMSLITWKGNRIKTMKIN